MDSRSPQPWRISPDTAPQAQDAYCAILAAMPFDRKLAVWSDCMAMGRGLAAVHILRDHPGIGESELRLRTAMLWYGRELVQRAYPHTADWPP